MLRTICDEQQSCILCVTLALTAYLDPVARLLMQLLLLAHGDNALACDT
jgi:hypothetical protein